ncbi:MAG: hypothetical protein ACKOTZ_11470 [Chloroflexota bacterium]
MSTAPPRRRARPTDPVPTTPDLLCYRDQASFLALRALGRGPMPSITWVYDVPVPTAAVERFNQRLGAGFLGRLVQRSPLPWGRHRWVAAPPPPVLVMPDPIAPADVVRWSNGLVDLRLDPERGPGWQLVAQPLTDGGLALGLIVSHTIADGLGFVQAIVDAVNEVPFPHVHPPRSARRSWILRDLRETGRALPDMGRALATLARRPPRAAPAGPTPSDPGPSGPAVAGSAGRVDLPRVRVVIEEAELIAAAQRLHGDANTLIVAFSARLAARIGRVRPDGRAELVLPISERVPGDPRGNAVTGLDLVVDPEGCREDLRPVQRDLKRAMVALLREGHPVMALLPLIPWIPTRVARRLEAIAAGSPWTVGCSLYGDVDPALRRVCGVEPARFWATQTEAFTEAALVERGGLVFVGGGRIGGRTQIFVSAWQPGRVTTEAELVPAVQAALADLGLAGRLD